MRRTVVALAVLLTIAANAAATLKQPGAAPTWRPWPRRAPSGSQQSGSAPWAVANRSHAR
ncbi:hypothetical protein [Kutzneria sp. NPDC051319]|uniref:hypothetical protein n=1 Tax=Kutzneria sp. NPDC051319 TaxID=3155047 RepID=UPI003447D929